MLSQTAEYALRAVLHIAANGAERPVPVGEVADALDVPRNYLSKTLHQLSRAGVLTSTFGPGGGFRLARPASDLTLDAVVGPFDASTERHCLLGRTRCVDSAPCVAHEQWKPVAEQVHRFFSTTSVTDLLNRDRATVASAPAPRRRLSRKR